MNQETENLLKKLYVMHEEYLKKSKNAITEQAEYYFLGGWNAIEMIIRLVVDNNILYNEPETKPNDFKGIKDWMDKNG